MSTDQRITDIAKLERELRHAVRDVGRLLMDTRQRAEYRYLFERSADALTMLRERVLRVADRQQEALDGGGWSHSLVCNYQRTDIDFCNCGLAQLQALARQLRATS